jgi:hypothetical protein
MLKTLLLTLILCSPTAIAETVPVVAQAPDKNKDSIRLEMMVVHGTTTNNAVDPQLRHLMKYFRNYKFTGFKLIDSQSSKLFDKTAKTFTIEGNRKVTISLISHTPKSAKLKVVILEGKAKKILDTTININRNGTFIVAGPKYKGGVLFLPIQVKY